MRVCQPGPVAFHEAMTSGGSRRDSNCFGFASRGLPRRTTFCPRRSSASSIQESVISGASSLLEVRTEPFRFALMAMPLADDPAGRPPRRPDEHHQARVKPPGRDVTALAVIVAIVGARQMQSGEHFPGPTHVQSPLVQRLQPLCGVTGDAHLFTVATLIGDVKSANSRLGLPANT
jgi:hypothetical protein